MKTTTIDFLNLQSRHNYKPYKTIECYKRVWDSGTLVYKWESTALNLLSYLDSVTSLNWSLDTEGLNKWKVSNITLTLKNTNNEFDEDNSESLFYGYSLHKSKIKIKCGYKKDDGTYDTIYVFNGIIEKEPVYDYVKKKVILNVNGLEIFTETASAEEIGVLYSDENIGTGSSLFSQEFTLDNNGVGKIVNLKIDGIEQFKDLDYTVTDLNVYNRPAKITMTPDAPTGSVVTCSYICWYQDKTIQWLIGELLSEAGFDSDNREISNAIFYSGESRKIWDTQVQFELSTRSRNIDTNSQTGDIMQTAEDFDDLTLDNLNLSAGVLFVPNISNKYEANQLPENATPAWTNTKIGTMDSRAASSGEFVCVDSTPNTDTFDENRIANATKTGIFNCKISVSTDEAAANGHISLGVGDGFFGAFLYIFCSKIGASGYVSDAGGYQTYSLDTSQYHQYWIVYTRLGHWDLYIDGVYVFEIGGSSNESEIYFEAYKNSTAGAVTFNWAFNYVYWDADAVSPGGTALTGTATSTALDFGQAPIDYGKIFKDDTVLADGSSITYETQTSGTSNFSLDNDSWRTVTMNGDVGTISSGTVKKRYLRWRVTLIMGNITSPEVSEVTMPASILFNFVDCTTDLYTYGIYSVWKSLNSQQINSYSASSSDSVTFDTELLITSEIVSSTVKRYIKFRNIISKIVSGTKAVIHRNRFLWNIQSFTIKMANFSDMTVQQVIEILAFIVNYEIGISALGKYFFRTKTGNSNIDWAFDINSDIIEIVSVKPLWEKIYNKISVRYGGYEENSDELLALESRPNTEDKFGTKFLKLSETNIYIDPDTNIAKGIMETYYDRYKNIGNKKEVIFNSKAILQLDLGDTVSINDDNLINKTFKVVGINLDIEKWEMGVTVWEN